MLRRCWIWQLLLYCIVEPKYRSSVWPLYTESKLETFQSIQQICLLLDQETNISITILVLNTMPVVNKNKIQKRDKKLRNWTGKLMKNCFSSRNVYKVAAAWALDLEQYNEWMNEEDYEVDDNGLKKVHKYRLSVDDLMAQPSHPPSSAKKPKRKRSPSPPPKIGKRKRSAHTCQTYSDVQNFMILPSILKLSSFRVNL